MQNYRFLMYCEQELVNFPLLIKKARNVRTLAFSAVLDISASGETWAIHHSLFFNVTACLWCTNNQVLFIGFFSKWKWEKIRKDCRIYSHLFQINCDVKYKKSRNMEMVNKTGCSRAPKSLESREIKQTKHFFYFPMNF